MTPDGAQTRWAVVGGGMLGAVAARRLAATGASVVLYESAPDLGGLASCWRLDVPDAEPITWDRYYHVVVGSDRRLLTLLDELGVDPVIWGSSRAACYSGGTDHPASAATELMRLPFLGPIAKLRMVLNVLWALVQTSAMRVDRITAAEWLRRWSGEQATERFWLPLLRAKLGGFAESASATFIWATMRRLVTARFQGGTADRFGHVPGGYASVLRSLADQLAGAGVEVRTGCRVREVRAVVGKLWVTEIGGQVESYTDVLITTAAPIAAQLCPDLTETERVRLAEVPYLGVVCPSVVLRRPVTGAYITYITDSAPFTAVIEMTALVDPAELGGHTLVYLPRYTDPSDPMFDLGDDELRAGFVGALLSMYPHLCEDDVLSFAVSRARLVVPVPAPGYLERVPPVDTSVPGLFTVGSAQTVDGTLNVEQTLKLLDEAWPQLSLPRAQRPGTVRTQGATR